MSSYLHKWGQRVQGATPSLSPRIPSLFETPGGLPATPTDPHSGINDSSPPPYSPTPPTAVRTPASRPPTSSPHFSSEIPHASARPSEPGDAPTYLPAPPSPQPSPPPTAPMPSAPKISSQPTPPSDPPSAVQPWVSTLRPPRSSATPPETDLDSSDPQPSEAIPSRGEDLPTLRTELYRLRQWMESPTDLSEIRETSSEALTPDSNRLSSGAKGAPGTLSRNQTPVTPAVSPMLAASLPEPVHIHIDTIILRSTAPTLTRTRPPSPAPDRVASLNQYLARRRARRT